MDRPRRILYSFVGLITAVLIVYSQTAAYSWDEGFHLVAAQLIKAGERPYLDFCFPQTPLNAYWNALLMRFAGDGWRAVHLVASLFTGGAVLLIADFIYRRLPVERWRLPGAIAAAALFGFAVQVVWFGTIGQAYGICLLLSVAAFRLAILAADRENSLLIWLAGLSSGAAAASSLLTAAVSPAILLWLLFYNRAGNRWRKAIAFLAGCVIPFSPVIWLFLKSPKLVLFNVLQYQAKFRRENWGDATSHDVDVFLSWVDSAQGLAVVMLAIAGVWFILKKSDWAEPIKAEFYLAGLIALAMNVELATAHPTFERYFLLVMPFMAILAVAGLTMLDPRWLALILALSSVDLAKAIYDDRTSYKWSDMEQVAKKVAEVTPPGAMAWLDEPTFFLLRRTPPDGMEFSYAKILELPNEEAARLHILTETELKRRLAAGVFSTVLNCDSDEIAEMKLGDLYKNQAKIAECTIFWDWKR